MSFAMLNLELWFNCLVFINFKYVIILKTYYDINIPINYLINLIFLQIQTCNK